MFRKVMQMIQNYAEKKLLDEVFATYLDVQDAAAEMAQVLPCPRCGKLTMKMRLHSNALSRQVPGIMICDQCGTEEALDCEPDEILVRVPNPEPRVRNRTGFEKPATESKVGI